MIHQEAGGVRGNGWEVTGGIGQLDQAFDDALVGALTAHHLNNLHQRHGIEEVEACDAARMLGATGNTGDRERRGIGSQYAIFADDGFQIGEQLLFYLQQLDDSFDHQVAVFQVFQLLRGLHAGNCCLQLRLGHFAFGLGTLQEVAVELQRVINGFGAGIEQLDLLTAAGE